MSDPKPFSNGTEGDAWPDTSRGPWQLTFHWAEQHGRFVCVGLDVRSFRLTKTGTPKPIGDDLVEVTSTVLRSMPVAELVRAAKRDAKDLMKAIASDPAFGANRRAKRAAAAIASDLDAPTPGRYGEDHFLEVATIYARAWAAGEPPTREVAAQMQVSPGVAGKWVARARTQYGFLEPTEKRKANGNLTPKARALLEGRP